jgi:hypothetical protein
VKAWIYVAAALIVLLGVFYFYRISTRNAVEKMAQNKKMINILVEGSNTYNDNKHKFYSIVSINPDNNRIGITFLPPNFRVTIDGFGRKTRRIDEIDIDNFSKISKSLSRELKLHIPFYIEIYAVDVEKIVDLIEGLDIFVLDQVRGMEGVTQGANYFDGRKTVQYINNVEANSIYRKYDRIQDILFTLYYNREKYRRFTGAKYLSHLMKNINTNLLDQELASLIKMVYDEPELMCSLIPGGLDESGCYVVDDIAYKLYEKEFLAKLVVNENSDTSIKVKILNGTNVPGLAKKMRNILVREGLNVVEFGTSPYPFMDQTIIINQKGDLAGVKKVSEILGINKIYNIVDSTQLNNALIIIGKDYVR